MTDQITVGQILGWIADHLAIVGWPTLLVLAWKTRGSFDEFKASCKMAGDKIESTETTALGIKADVDTMTTNHMAHMQKSMEDMTAKQDKTNEVLTSIDKGLTLELQRANDTQKRAVEELTHMREDFQAHALDDKYTQKQINDSLVILVNRAAR